MAKNNSTDSIPPFPEEIDRDYFGTWLSGFTDGEGCFNLGIQRNERGCAHRIDFSISLRADDFPIIKLIQSYLQCGKVKSALPKRLGHPITTFFVYNIPSIRDVIVPHFEKYPLLAKKARDFMIWKQAAKLCFQAYERRRNKYAKSGGCFPRWEKEEHDRFCTLMAVLRKQRIYQSPAIEIPPIPNRPKIPGLFDFLRDN